MIWIVLGLIALTVLIVCVRGKKTTSRNKADQAADKLRHEFGLTPHTVPSQSTTIMRFDDTPEDRAKKKSLADATWRQTDALAQKYTVQHSEDETVRSVTSAQFFKKSNRQYVAFDVETTGLDPATDRIVEIAAVRVLDDQIVDSFRSLVDPGVRIPLDAQRVHGITDAMVEDSPLIERVLPEFLEFMGNDMLAAHNAAFDIRFVGMACIRHDYQIPNAYFDTMGLARLWPAAPNKKLSTLARAAGITQAQDHRALGDAELVAQLIAAARKQMQK